MKNPETMPASPEFIKVVYDEKGRPLDIVPVKEVPSLAREDVQKPQKPMQAQLSPQPVNQEAMVNWIVSLGQHIKALREDLRLLAIFTQKRFNEFQPIILNQIEKQLSKTSPLTAERFSLIENEMAILKNQYDSILEKFGLMSNRISDLAEKIEGIKFPEKEIFDQLNLLGMQISSTREKVAGIPGLIENYSSKPSSVILEKLQTVSSEINSLTEKIEAMKVPSEAVTDQLKSMDLRMSTFASEIAETKLHEIETSKSLKSVLEKISVLNQEMENQKLLESSFKEKFDSVEKELKAINDSILQSNAQTQEMVSKIEEKLNDSRIEEELDSLKANTAASIEELSKSQEQIKAELLANQQVSKNALDEIFKIQKMLRKPKKRQVKPQRAKVIRFLKKNFKIKPFSKVLVVTDKRNSVFGKTLYEATRKISKKSILAIVENRTSESSLDRPVVEAVKQSSYVFIASNHSMRKIEKISRKLDKTKIVLIKRTLKYSVL